MKRLAFSVALCALAACSEAPTVAGPDPGPQFALTPGDPTWNFEGVVGAEQSCGQGNVVQGSITFDDDAPLFDESPDGAWYHSRMSWDVTIGGVREQGSKPCTASGDDCGNVWVKDEYHDTDHNQYVDQLELWWESGAVRVQARSDTPGIDLLDGLEIPAVPPAGGDRAFFFPCPDGSGAAAELTRLEASIPPSPRTKDDCKNGRWATFGFKNQGQCVRFVETGKDSR